MRQVFLLLLFFLLSACKEDVTRYNGYIDADLTYLSSNFAGRLTHLFVSRGQTVQKNQLLFKLEQTHEQFAVATSQFNQDSLMAQRNEIINQIHYADINYRRTMQMRKDNAASQNDMDLAIRDREVLNNQLIAIDFQIKSSHEDIADRKWQVERKENFAHDLGIIFDTYFTENEYVQPGQPVLSLITKKNIKAIFFVNEQALSRILLNKKINILSDGNPSPAVGVISYISNIAQYTPPILYSREDRQQLVFRVEAHLIKPNLNQIHLGQPVTLELAQ